MADFEEAPVSALQQIFGIVTVAGYWFYYAQAVFKSLATIGLRYAYLGNRDMQKIIRCLLSLGGTKIKLASHIKSLGITLDNSLTFSNHISNICQISYYHIRALRHIRKSLNKEDAKTVASALIGARLDYCNSLLYGIPKIAGTGGH